MKISLILFIFLTILTLHAQQNRSFPSYSKGNITYTEDAGKTIITERKALNSPNNPLFLPIKNLGNFSPVSSTVFNKKGLPKKLNSVLDTLFLLNNTIYTFTGLKYKDSFEYDDNNYKIIYIKQIYKDSTVLWENLERHTYTYNSDGYLVQDLYEFWNSSTHIWKSYSKFIYSYDHEGNLVLIEQDAYNSETGEWYTYYRRTMNYNDDGNMTLDVTESIFYDEDCGLRNFMRFSYIYNDSGYAVQKLWELWDKDKESWEYQQLFSRTFDDYGKLLREVTSEWNSLDAEWFSVYNELYNYNDHGFITSHRFQDKNQEDDSWENMYRYVFEYDTLDNLLIYRREDWVVDSHEWVNSYRFTYSYDEYGNCLLNTFEYPNPENNDWDIYWRKTYTYDDNNNLEHFLFELLDSSIWTPEPYTLYFSNNGYSYTYYCDELYAYYDQITSIEKTANLPLQFSLSQNYPNPFNPRTTIKYSIPRQDFVTLKIYNTLGQEVAALVNEEKQPGSYHIVFDASALSSGVYFYRLKSGSFSKIRKLVLLK